MEKEFSFKIGDEDREQRVDSFLAARIPDLTRSRIQDLIKQGCLKINEISPKISYRLKRGDEVTLNVPPAQPYYLEPESIKFGVIHEDQSLIVLNKPPGLVIHPAPGHHTGTLAHGLLEHCKDLSGIGGVMRPGIVHRLDKDTSGLLVVAKNDRVHNHLSKQFKSGTVNKTYLALVRGVPGGRGGEIDQPIARHPKKRKEMSAQQTGKGSKTFWKKIDDFGGVCSLLAVTPKTGRTHQIRVHLSYLGHPIIGDPVYGSGKGEKKRRLSLYIDALSSVKRQMLHAQSLGFIHPDTGEYCEFHAPIPGDMAGVLHALKTKKEKDKRLDIKEY